MAKPAHGAADRGRMARNHYDLSERYTWEGWRATKYASRAARRDCSGLTKNGEACLSPVGYGAFAEGDTRRPANTEEPTHFYCHRHATARLAAEEAGR